MANTDFDLKFAVNNLFDKQYVDQASFGYSSRFSQVIGVPEVGRDFRLTASMRFLMPILGEIRDFPAITHRYTTSD